jgi:hypothetical protein
MLGCIWSCPTAQMLRFPVATMIRFCHNHGLLQITRRPQWWTVAGGARHYVQAIVRGLRDARLATPVLRIERHPAQPRGGGRIHTASGSEVFDRLVLATHSDQALALAVNRRAALSAYERDHGDGRAVAAGGALGWLEELLQREGIADADGEIWLQTYPRVLSYTFRPVSFWYAHRHDGTLRAIVAEVNNTFGERHCYLLDAPRWGAQAQAHKVFHVSPFCRFAAWKAATAFVFCAPGMTAWSASSRVWSTTTRRGR